MCILGHYIWLIGSETQLPPYLDSILMKHSVLEKPSLELLLIKPHGWTWVALELVEWQQFPRGLARGYSFGEKEEKNSGDERRRRSCPEKKKELPGKEEELTGEDEDDRRVLSLPVDSSSCVLSCSFSSLNFNSGNCPGVILLVSVCLIGIFAEKCYNWVVRMTFPMEKSMRDMANQEMRHQLVCTHLPLEQNASGVELKPGFIRLLPTFHGWEHEDPHQHIREFILVCSSMTPSGAAEELVMMKAFPLSLQDTARYWMIYQQQPFGSWQEMQIRFLNRFFPASRVSYFRRQICTIEQGQNESLSDFWDRFNKLCLMCPNHQLQDSLLLTYFYEGLLQRERMLVDVAAGGSLMNKTPVEARQLLSNMAECSYQGSIYNKVAVTVSEIGTESKDLRELTQVMSQLVEQVMLLNQEPAEDKRTASEVLDWSENTLNATRDSASNNWEGKWSTMNLQGPHQDCRENEQLAGCVENDKKSCVAAKTTSAEDHGITKYIPPHLRGKSKLGKMQPAQKKEVQLDRTASTSAVILRSGKELHASVEKEKNVDEEQQPEIIIEPPFPVKSGPAAKKLETDADLLKIFQKVEINMPLLEAIKQVPKYAKFLKEVCTYKRGLRRPQIKNISTISKLGLPTKHSDPGHFTIPCTIGELTIANALVDLGASINVMPSSVYKALHLGKLKPTSVIIQLANRSTAKPLGILEDVLVRVNQLMFPADFYVLEMEGEDSRQSPTLILGRPFLMTAKTIINVHEGHLTMEFGDTQVRFNIFEAMSHPLENHSDLFSYSEIYCNNLELLEKSDLDIVEGEVQSEFCTWDEEQCLEAVELQSSEEENELDIKGALKNGEKPAQETPEQQQKSELKLLPLHLKYAYLEDENKFPVIISASLKPEQEEQLLQVLKKHKKAIGWTLEDIPGISPALCMHRILLDSDAVPVRQPQRRLNPAIQEVVKDEVSKLLKAGMVFPISDSTWVSPVQVVPKKSGMTIVKNQEGEFVPTRVANKWRVCIDYRRLNQSTRKDHFPLPFIDQVIERLAGKPFYCFLDGFSGYMQIHIHPEDQHKTTFTCPFGTYAYTRMPFGLCNAPATFQRCMLSIFSELIESCMEVFMDDFTVFGASFDECLGNLEKVLKKCIETDLVLNFEKCHFMVNEGIVLGHVISEKGFQVDKSKIDVVSALPYPSTVREVRSFLGHAGFYRRFIQNFSNIALPLSRLLQKEVVFDFDEVCKEAFDELKGKLTTAPILQPPNWELPFELMCDASDFALGAVLSQKSEKIPHVIAYASRTLDAAQRNYTTTEKELLAIIFALDKYRPYLLGSKTVVHTDHSALKYLMKKADSKPRLMRWLLLMQEFDIEIKDRSGALNQVADHLSRITGKEEEIPLNEKFPDEFLFSALTQPPWYAELVNYLAADVLPAHASRHYIDKLKSDAKYYVWDDPFLWRFCSDKIIRKCVPDSEINGVLHGCHDTLVGGHFGPTRTARRVLDSGFFWPTLFKDAYNFVKSCEVCQKAGGNITRRNEMPLQKIIFCEIFDVWGIDFMGPLPNSSGYSYILLAVDYVSRWVEAKATRSNDARTVSQFLKTNIFCRFGVPKAIISDQGTHFCNQLIAALLSKYGVKHKVSTPYHPQTNGQAEVFNREVKKLLQKLVQPNRKNWSQLLDEALWAQRTAYRTLLGMSPFRIVFGKSCHLPVEIEHKAFWAVKRCNLEYNAAGKQRKLQLQELDEIRLEAYENSRFYKEKVKRFHDRSILRKEFSIGQKVLLYNSKMKLIAGKLRSKWEGPYEILKVFPNGAVEIRKLEADKSFMVNGHQLKIFHEKQPLEKEEKTLQFNDPVLENPP
ncbi:hypothetical protein V8G54_008789 [Vigna mungo]|uniref:RNA-directed DNA polymerase n=1 Tax=Vigna mungo TaxID=3915 RepID=A0AAQ3S8J5_VIGMU